MELYSKEELLKELKKEYSCGGECEHCPEVLDAGSCAVLRCIRRIIDNATPVDIKDEIAGAYNEGYMCGNKEAEKGRPQGELKEYKPLEPDYNVQCAVENLRSAYWSNEPEKVAKNFTEAEDIIISAICHHGYAVCKQPQGEWITQEGYDGDEYYECSVCKDAFVLMEGTPKENNYNYCPNCGADMRGEKE